MTLRQTPSTTRRPALARRAVAAALAATLLAGSALAADLTVSAAASLTNAFMELKPLYEASRPGVNVQFNFAASDALVAQIEQGAPVDVFAAADEPSMDRAEAGRLLAAGSRRDFAGNTLVVITPGTGAVPLHALADLKSPAVKHVAMGQPTGVPAGRYARVALEAAGLWPAVGPKAVYAQNVRQALDYVSRGEAEAGFVYATDAAIAKGKVSVAFSVPTISRISYPVAAVSAGPHVDEGRRFAEFLVSPSAQAVLAKYGFVKP